MADCKHQSASDKHGQNGCAERVAPHVCGGIALRNASEIVPKVRLKLPHALEPHLLAPGQPGRAPGLGDTAGRQEHDREEHRKRHGAHEQEDILDPIVPGAVRCQQRVVGLMTEGKDVNGVESET